MRSVRRLGGGRKRRKVCTNVGSGFRFLSGQMASKFNPWATPEAGFERYEGSRDVDDFQPLDTQASDLAAFLQSDEVRQMVQPSRSQPAVETVTLPSGAVAQIVHKSDTRSEERRVGK